MSILESLSPIQIALDTVRDYIINPHLKTIAEIKKITYKDKKITVSVTLDGMGDELFEVSCKIASVAEDGSNITLTDFKSNKTFLENALKKFLVKPIPAPENPIARNGLKAFNAFLKRGLL